MVGQPRKRLRAFLERSGRRRWTDTNLMTSCWSGAAMMSSRLGGGRHRANHRFVPGRDLVRTASPDGGGTRGGKSLCLWFLFVFLDDPTGHAGPAERGSTELPRHWIESGRPFRWCCGRGAETTGSLAWRSSKTRARELHACKIRIPAFCRRVAGLRLERDDRANLPTRCRSTTEETTCPSQSGRFIRYSLEKSPASTLPNLLRQRTFKPSTQGWRSTPCSSFAIRS